MLHTRRKKKILSVVLSVILAFSVVPLDSIIVKAENTDIKSLVEVPAGYEAIYTIEDLYGIRNDLGGKYILMNDIDMSKATEKGGDYDCGTGWKPIGSMDQGFYGTFDGNGHKIIGMHIFGEFIPENEYDVSVHLGLFEDIYDGGSIMNLGMVDCNIDVTAAQGMNIHAGCIAGNAYADIDKGIIMQNCYVDGIVQVQVKEGNSYAGGLLGSAWRYDGSGTVFIRDSYNVCDMVCSGNDGTDLFVGGILGTGIVYATVKRCYNVGKIDAGNVGGAICGEGDEFTDIESCQYLRGTAKQGIAGVSDRITGCMSLTETQMRVRTSFNGYDFSNIWEVDTYCSYAYPQLKKTRMVRINSIKLDSMPTKLIYNQGETLELTGAALEINYEDGINTSIPLDKEMLSGYDMNRIGRQTVMVSYGGEKAAFDIEVKEIPVTQIALPMKLSLNRSKEQSLKVTIMPSNATDKSVTWESDNPSVASVSGSGVVKAKAKGTAVITATAANGLQAQCTVTVLVPAVSVKISKSSLSMKVGDRKPISAQALPLESTDTIRWKSSKTAVAEVNNGAILAKKEGTAKITAYTASGVSASCTVTVKKTTDNGAGTANAIKKVNSTKAKIKSAKNVKGKKAALKLSGHFNCDGYKIQYGLKKNFKGAKTITSKSGTATIKKLKLKKTYYIRVRVYKKISGKIYYGKWSNRKSVKIRK